MTPGYCGQMSWQVVTPYRPYATPELELAKKYLFAAAWLRSPTDVLKAANEIEPEHAARAIWITQNWQLDPVVIAEKERLLELAGPIARVPSKEEFALELYKLANDPATKSTGDKLAAYRFFAELMDYTQKAGSGGTNININNQLTAKIMAVPIASSDEQWEKIAIEHSKTLMLQHERH